mmetsp:Transcript_33634/g.24657  ORF Transcript_33634/g.24657 Transcript_33634/m.24657 type:complete len:107 (+) Transcript_33634:486-806(+)
MNRGRDGPPSFYEQDMDRWRMKFNDSIEKRKTFKKSFQNTYEWTSFNKNLNVSGNLYGARVATSQDKKEGDSTMILKRVMQRRKSRQSTCSPCNVDVNYIGNSAAF